MRHPDPRDRRLVHLRPRRLERAVAPTLPVLLLAGAALATPREEELAWATAFGEVRAALALPPDVRLVLGPDGEVALAGPTATVAVGTPHEDSVPSRVEQLYVAVARLQAPTARASLASLAPASDQPLAPPAPRAPEPASSPPAPPDTALRLEQPVVLVLPPPPPPEPTVAVVLRPPTVPTEPTPPPPVSPPPARAGVAALVGVTGAGPSGAVEVGRRAAGWWAAVRLGGGHEPDARRKDLAYPVTAPVRASSVEAGLAAGVDLPDLPIELGVSAAAAQRWLATPDRTLGGGLVPVVGAFVAAEVSPGRLLLRPELGVAHDLRATELTDELGPVPLVSTRAVARIAVGVRP